MTIRTVRAYVENDAGMAQDHASAAWSFDLDHWGQCGQGGDEPSALLDLQRTLGAQAELAVAERVTGDEHAFDRDRQPCTDLERQATMAILREVRPQTIDLLRSCSETELDRDDRERILPSYARWRTLRQMGWHIADTETRYYLPCLGHGTRDRAGDPAGDRAGDRAGDLMEELELSAQHVLEAVEAMSADLVVDGPHGTWTSVKVLRRLAWHERGELAVMRSMLTRARLSTGDA